MEEQNLISAQEMINLLLMLNEKQHLEINNLLKNIEHLSEIITDLTNK